MPNKAYAILYGSNSTHSGYLYFPIKRDDARDFPGMPQFFGGTKNVGESDRDTIAREMAEESDDKLHLLAGGLTRVYQGIVNGDTYNFYVATNYQGTHFLGPLSGNPEMKSIEKFYTVIGEGDDMEDLMNRLSISPSQAFTASETWAAFGKAIEWVETPYNVIDKKVDDM